MNSHMHHLNNSELMRVVNIGNATASCSMSSNTIRSCYQIFSFGVFLKRHCALFYILTLFLLLNYADNLCLFRCCREAFRRKFGIITDALTWITTNEECTPKIVILCNTTSAKNSKCDHSNIV